MKTVATINPELEYQNAKKIIEQASLQALDSNSSDSLNSSVEKLITTARVLMEREERRRGKKKERPKTARPKGRQKGQGRAESKKLPSDRYPGLEVEEFVTKQDRPPLCPCCNEPMRESGLFDTSEKLETIPARYFIKRTARVKYNCGSCHGAMVNTPADPSIVPSSNYGDSLIIDVSLSKYCDLIPIERYVQIAFRAGLKDLPAQSMIGLTHHLANFLLPLYELIKTEVQASIILYADETPHKMLEGDETCNWYLWGFFNKGASYFEAHGTRSGDVAVEFLKGSNAKYLMSDGYTGYNKAIRITNERESRNLIGIDCNAHTFRYFKETPEGWKEVVQPFLEAYGEIYDLEEQRREGEKELSNQQQLELRQQMIPHFENIKTMCEKEIETAPTQSGYKKALGYFLNHYEGLTLCTTKPEIPLDNNLAEREVRAPVVGRKTWYGTHSKRGARTGAILFSVVQSCKLCNVNPRVYFPWVVEQIHNNKEILTPSKYKELQGPG